MNRFQQGGLHLDRWNGRNDKLEAYSTLNQQTAGAYRSITATDKENREAVPVMTLGCHIRQN
ncbi:MAG: hypothetical protein O2856_10130 [Planctomycetota bacterium]|nr:hypothetical protein [Planctomycetota bacterium]